MQTVHLFSESTTPTGSYDILVEQKTTDEKPNLKIKGIYARSDCRNANSRIYPTSVLKAAIADYNRDYIAFGRSLGELGHPEHFDVVFQDSCIKIELLEQSSEDPTAFIGEAIVLQSDPSRGIKGTPSGDILASMLQYGVKVGVSTRALGKVDSNNIVQPGLKLVAVDCVANPSGPGCYVDGILESKQFLINEHGEVFEKAFKDLSSTLSSLPVSQKQKMEHFRNAFADFMTTIKQG